MSLFLNLAPSRTIMYIYKTANAVIKLWPAVAANEKPAPPAFSLFLL
jgi:hypothetical protein